MARQGWHRLLAEAPQPYKPGEFPIAAYSEFMPPPRIGRKPYGGHEPMPFRQDDPFGWHVTEYEEAVELRPGLEHLAGTCSTPWSTWATAGRPHGIARAKLEGNPYWPPELAERAGDLPHERYVVLLPLALSRTQDDKGRVRWTLFGGSEQGPERAFWQRLLHGPGPRAARRLRAWSSSADCWPPPTASRRSGWPICARPAFASCRRGGRSPVRLLAGRPAAVLDGALSVAAGESVGRVRYLLTFRPFGSLPAAVRRAYLAGDLHLLPFPGSLVFWGAPPFCGWRRELPLAMQIPLLHAFRAARGTRTACGCRSRAGCTSRIPIIPCRTRVTASLRNTYRRTHRWAPLHRHEDELAVADGEDRMAHVLFSTAPDDLGLYGKPMARNAQIWTHDFRLLLDGPRADRERPGAGRGGTARGGPCSATGSCFRRCGSGRHEVYWHRPLVAYLAPKIRRAGGVARRPARAI